MLERIRNKIAARVRRLLPARVARRFVRRQDGAAAVEFALVAAAVSGADLRDPGNGAGVLRRPDAGSRRHRSRRV